MSANENVVAISVMKYIERKLGSLRRKAESWRLKYHQPAWRNNESYRNG
jgi:hypothetical protein